MLDQAEEHCREKEIVIGLCKAEIAELKPSVAGKVSGESWIGDKVVGKVIRGNPFA